MQFRRALGVSGVLLCLLGTWLSAAGSLLSSSPLQAPSFSFTAAGDFGGTTNTTAVLGGIASSGAQFHMTLGDLSYGTYAPETAWCDYIKDKLGATFPFELVSGNHDADGFSQGHIDNFAACLPDRVGNLTGTYGKEYYFDYQNLARLIFISPNLTLDGQSYAYTNGSAHYNWLAAAIDGARAGNIPWVIVGMHKNCISTGAKSCEIGTDLFNLLVAKKVDLVLQGHDHNYQRGKQLAFNGTTCASIMPDSYNAACVADDGADNAYVQGAGMLLNVVGTGGQSLYGSNPADAEAGYFAKFILPGDTARYGFLQVTVTSAQLIAQFVPVTAGVFTDAYTISALTLSALRVRAPDATRVRVTWVTANETGLVSFNVWRRLRAGGEWLKLNAAPLAAQNPSGGGGARYRYADRTVVSGKRYYYKLEILRADNSGDWSDAVSVKVP